MHDTIEVRCGPLVIKCDGFQITVESVDGYVSFPFEADEALVASEALRKFASTVLFSDTTGEPPPRFKVVPRV